MVLADYPDPVFFCLIRIQTQFDWSSGGGGDGVVKLLFLCSCQNVPAVTPCSTPSVWAYQPAGYSPWPPPFSAG